MNPQPNPRRRRKKRTHAAKPEPVKAAKTPEPAKTKQAEAAKPKSKAESKGNSKSDGRTAKEAEPPKVKTAEAKPAEPKPAKRERKSAEKPAAEPRRQQVDATPTNSVAPSADVKAAAVADDKPEFRWPARGRVIQGFKSGGNDGINIAVPEGTSVKAAESGVVAYAGSELKGYGHLVLIRHPNGYVSAYAHNGELNVKRGETVKRGQDHRQIGPVRQCGDAATALRTAQGFDAGRPVGLSGGASINFESILFRLPRDTKAGSKKGGKVQRQAWPPLPF